MMSACRLITFLACVVPLANAGIVLQATPLQVESGLTMTLTLTCKVKPDSTTAPMASMTSLLISYPTGPGQPDLASAIGNSVRTIPPFNGTATGSIDPYGDSFLSVTIDSPTDANTGRYMCNAFGMDVFGRPSPAMATIMVDKHVPDVQTLAVQMKTMGTRQTQLMDLMKKQDVRWQHIDQDSTFWQSPEINGTKYLLSKSGFGNVHLSQFICFVHGGYLAEVNDAAEFRYIRDFVTSLLVGAPADTDVFLGATDEVNETDWVFLHNQNDTVFLDWGGFASNGYDCLVLSKQTQFYMNDCRCESHNRFLCEIHQ